jgi:hypothetical protein
VDLFPTRSFQSAFIFLSCVLFLHESGKVRVKGCPDKAAGIGMLAKFLSGGAPLAVYSVLPDWLCLAGRDGIRPCDWPPSVPGKLEAQHLDTLTHQAPHSRCQSRALHNPHVVVPAFYLLPHRSSIELQTCPTSNHFSAISAKVTCGMSLASLAPHLAFDV